MRASKAAGDAATGRQRAPAAADQDDTPSCSGSGLAQQQQQRSAVKRSEHLRGAALLVVAAAAAATSLAQPTPAGATAVAAPPAPAPAPSPSTPYATSSSSSSSSSRGGSDGQPDMTITHLVYLDIAIATRAFKPAEQRTLGDKSVLPDSAAPAGRIVLGLYGRAAPATVSNFLAVVTSGALAGTTFSRVLPGEYVMAGKQGARRMGELEPPADLQVL